MKPKVADKILRHFLFVDFLHEKTAHSRYPNSDFDSSRNALQTKKEKNK